VGDTEGCSGGGGGADTLEERGLPDTNGNAMYHTDPNPCYALRPGQSCLADTGVPSQMLQHLECGWLPRMSERKLAWGNVQTPPDGRVTTVHADFGLGSGLRRGLLPEDGLVATEVCPGAGLRPGHAVRPVQTGVGGAVLRNPRQAAAHKGGV